MTVLFLLMAFTVPGKASADVLKIGIILPFTGSKAAFGQEMRRGFEIAIDILEERGGIKGKYHVQPIWCDVPTVDAAIAEAERLIGIEKVPIIVGTFGSDIAYAASTIAERNHVVYWEGCSPADALTERGYKYLFRTCSSARSEGEIQVQFVHDNAALLGKRPGDLKIAVVGEDSVYGTSIVEGVVARAKELGIKIVHKELYSGTVTDLSPLIMKLKLLKPDVICMGHRIDDGMLFYRQARELGLNARAIIGTGGCFGAETFRETFGHLSDYVLCGNYPGELTPPGFAPGLPDFMARYKAKYKRDNIFSVHSLAAYHSFMVLWEALESSKSLRPDDIREAVLALDIAPGKIANGWGAKFAPPGHPSAGTNLNAFAVMTQWQDGKLYMVWPEAYPGKQVVLPYPTWAEREAAKK